LKSQQKMLGQVGIVTGAGTPHGIGRELVKKLAEAGALAVYACDLNLGAVSSLQKEIRAAGYSTLVEGRLLDVSDEQRTQDIVKEITETHGRFDFFFANAGFAHYR
jgi:3-oxoacyl-[acyl-carrier protein] reductase